MRENFRSFVAAGCCQMCAMGFALAIEARRRGEVFEHGRPEECRATLRRTEDGIALTCKSIALGVWQLSQHGSTFAGGVAS